MSNKIPKHQAIARILRDRVWSGELEPGTPLPSIDQLREELGASPAMLKKAIEELISLKILKPSESDGTPMVPERTGTKYRAIAAILRARVASGEWEPGARINSRRFLREEFYTSRATIDKVIDLLTVEGVLDSSDRNRPPVVALPPHTQTVQSRVRRSAETGQALDANETSKIVSAEMVAASPSIAGQLGVNPGTKVLRRTRVNFVDDVPVATGFSYYPPEVTELTPELKALRSIPAPGSRELAAERMGSAQASAYYEVTGRLASDEERDLLQLQGTYVIVVQTARLVVLEDGRVVEVAVKVAEGNRPVRFEDSLTR